ncbi:penicillin acylase family protein [Fulvivirgaceae bacterium BMA10]|uniref:Penicillin acylase family protein n=1 Tax=Splendidivirga corallicola TaxID=3051826 RepID=A0ABT8KMM1_9BACT|nr:penicillin acylase family protein [Fulvivirgaceae bacterium BMA10]
MKFLKIFLIFILAILLLSSIATYVYLNSLIPNYSGEQFLHGLQEEVEVFYDEYGIPHIYAKNEEDAYFALGYVHAQERLFQMEIIKRVASGRLSEILGKDLIQTDKLFRTLGIKKVAEASAAKFLNSREKPFQKAAWSYIDGFNAFIEHGDTPIEFQILGIQKEKLGPEDIYLIAGFMSFGFAEGFKVDPVLTKIKETLGEDYLIDLALDETPEAYRIPTHKSTLVTDHSDQLAIAVSEALDYVPAPLWQGSNGWVLAPKRSKSGKVILENDTHMGFSQPSVWFEAHYEYPGFRFYGNHAAGFPFALIGHSDKIAWGLTMFENDDVDFYKERLNPENPNQVWSNDHWEELQEYEEVIQVKDADDVIFKVRSTRHGPLINEVFENVSELGTDPVSVWWSFLKEPNTALEATYQLAHATGIDQAREAAALINAPGLNVMYGDVHGNIAWWASARLVKRSEHVWSKVFLDGASGADEPLGYYDFAMNPKSENPESGFVYSTNNQPDSVDDILHPGYYAPQDRAQRLQNLLNKQEKWDLASIQKLSTDVGSDNNKALAGEMVNVLNGSGEFQEQMLEMLRNWNGSHQLEDVAPAIYHSLHYHILNLGMADELGEKSLKAVSRTLQFKRAFSHLIKNDSSVWWDNIHTPTKKETRSDIFLQALEKTEKLLSNKLGEDIESWHWAKLHTLEHPHPLGRVKPLNKLFNVGPFPVPGGKETINNLNFEMDEQGNCKVYGGPAMRIIVDFADVENSVSVNPTGQSGYFFGPHYADQAELYNEGRFRKQMMNREEIEQKQKSRLWLRPKL